ncbi:hypothetical protein NO2_1672, partial [Candidatus Termititenax persephonae]
MANDYGDQTKYKSAPYNIDFEKKITALGMRTALGTKEDVANKKDTLANSSAEYPSSAAVYAHTSNKNNPHGVTKAQVGLGSADNTSDANKPISTATQTALNGINTALNGKEATITAGTAAQYWRGDKTWQTMNDSHTHDTRYYTETEVDTMLSTVYAHTSNKNNPHGVTKAQVGLGSADNTSDANKPVSTATQTALNGKQALLPVGTILMYDGTGWADNSTLPGWYQCNGKNGTPDLRDKFIRGGRSGENMARGTTSGADSRSITLQTANLPSHNHSLTALTLANESAHTHSVSATTDTKTHSHTFSGNNLSGDTPYFQMDYSRKDTNNTNGIITSTTQVGGQTDSGGGHDTCASFSISFTPSGTINGNGSHAHSFTATSGAGSGHTHSLSSSTISNTGSGTAFT